MSYLSTVCPFLTPCPCWLSALFPPPEQDDEIGKIQAAVAAGMSANAAHLQAYLKNWDKYREIWEINKDSFIRHYRGRNPPVSSFDADIARYCAKSNWPAIAWFPFSLSFLSSHSPLYILTHKKQKWDESADSVQSYSSFWIQEEDCGCCVKIYNFHVFVLSRHCSLNNRCAL